MQICDNVTHIKGVKKEEGNYRPISLLTSMSKVIEIIMFKRLEMHLETNDILAVEQFGFRKGYILTAQSLILLTIYRIARTIRRTMIFH